MAWFATSLLNTESSLSRASKWIEISFSVRRTQDLDGSDTRNTVSDVPVWIPWHYVLSTSADEDKTRR